MITYFIERHQDMEFVYLVTIYDKSEEENITKNELLKVIERGIE
ncbi:hypothetical protein [Emticicia sp. 21SJ11W-3]|nr:hypothetical protein [Emticicia sp. 21SJ11W-3]